jgi:hypothetical protein
MTINDGSKPKLIRPSLRCESSQCEHRKLSAVIPVILTPFLVAALVGFAISKCTALVLGSLP